MKILGISAYYHDSAAALVCGGQIVAAAQQERFSRRRHDPDFPAEAVRFCLQRGGLQMADLDAIVFYDKPFLKFERLLETYYGFAPRGWFSFVKSMPVWIKEKLFLKKILKDELQKIGAFDSKKVRLLFPEHHLSHAASAFYPSPFEESAILTIDGVGEWATASIGLGRGKEIRILKELDFPHSLGLLYSAFTFYCGFKVNSGEYKLMGLAPYGNGHSERYQHFRKAITEKMVEIRGDGSLFLDQSFFQYASGLQMTRDGAWQQLLGIGRRLPEAPLDQAYCDLALAIQDITTEIVLKMAQEARRLTGSNHLCLAGGVALNCVANGRLEELKIFDSIYIQPAAGDAGGAVGAALAAQYIYFDQPRLAPDGGDAMQGALLGTSYDDAEIAAALQPFGAVYTQAEDFKTLCDRTAGLLAAGQVLGWFQGRMEFGPRALGARSILADARSEEMQKKLNLSIKFREGFRPFAPAVAVEQAREYFEMEGDSPYMLLVKPVKASRRVPLPAGYENWPMNEKLYFRRSDLPAITHIDYSARVQTVSRGANPAFWDLLQSFRALTGSGVLVNTSFNVRGEPIVESPAQAYACFMRTGMDALVIGNYLLEKNQQPAWQEVSDWKKSLPAD